MKKLVSVLLMVIMVTISMSTGVFGDYTSDFNAMRKNISALELKAKDLEESLNRGKLSPSEVENTKKQIDRTLKEIDIYKTSMTKLSDLNANEEIKKTQALKPSLVASPNASKLSYAGDFKLTAYCPCKLCSEGWGTVTASGQTAKEGITIATSKQFPFGTKLYIEGVGYRVVDDRGGAIKGNKIDIFVNSHNSCYNPAYNRVAKVYVVQ